MQTVFICGCSRSGTTSFADFLRAHQQIAMGRERYGKRLRLTGRLSPDLFEKTRFCEDLQPDDSHHRRLQPYYGELAERFESCTHIGDKIPNLFRHFPQIRSDYPEVKILFLARNIYHVADSFEVRAQRSRQHEKAKWPIWRDATQAVEEWNESLKAVLAFRDRLDLFVVDYDRLYKDSEMLAQVTRFLGVDASEELNTFWVKASEDRHYIDAKPRNHLSEEQLAYIKTQADFAAYETVLNLGR